MWSKYLSNNKWRDIRLQISAFSNSNVKFPIGKSIFAVNFLFQLFHATIIANADIERPKSLHTLFGKYLGHIWVNFGMGQTTRNFKGFDKKKNKKIKNNKK